jgi:hypothetical protein
LNADGGLFISFAASFQKPVISCDEVITLRFFSRSYVKGIISLDMKD